MADILAPAAPLERRVAAASLSLRAEKVEWGKETVSTGFWERDFPGIRMCLD